MSHQHSDWAVEARCESASEKAILMLIANYAGSDGTCYPGQETLARQACCSVKTVERALKAFEDRGWIRRVPRRRRDGSRTSDLICILAVNAPEPMENAQPDTVSGRAEPTRHPVQSNPTSCPSQPDTMSGLTTFEPPEEPSGEQGARASADAVKPDPDPVEPTPEACEAFARAYPAGGMANIARADLPLMLGPAAVRLKSMPRLIAAARAYAKRCEKHDSKPLSLRNWLANRSLVAECAGEGRPMAAGAPTPRRDATYWRSHVSYFQREGDWRADGPPPGKPGCHVPADILAEYGIAPKEAA